MLKLVRAINSNTKVFFPSPQVYKYLDIGSAKVDAATRSSIPHHLIDIIDPTQSFSAGDYHDEARKAIQVYLQLAISMWCAFLKHFLNL